MGRQIILLDDEADILHILTEALDSEGYNPVPFVNPNRALEYCLASPPALVITDLLMPAMNGQEFVLRLRERYGEAVPIVVMSASVNMAAVATLPIQAFLSKPFDLDDLTKLVERLLMATSNNMPSGVSPLVW